MTNFKKVLVTAPGKVSCAHDMIDETNIPDRNVLLKSKYSLISSGTELACLKGIEYWFSIPGTPGYCNVGEIIGIGNGVTGFNVGDVVFTDAGHYGMYYYPANRDPSRLIVKIPGDIREEYIPYIRMASIALTSVNVSDIQLGDKVLVAGLGVVGNFAAQFAQMQGADVLCSEPCEYRVKTAKECGLKNFADQVGTDFVERATEFTNGKGFDTVIEATGKAAVAETLFKTVKRNGEFILLGTPRGEYQTDLTAVLRRQHLADTNIAIKGAHEVRYPTWANEFVKHSRERNVRRIVELIFGNRLSIQPMITKITVPEEAQNAYDSLMYHADENMSILFDFTK